MRQNVPKLIAAMTAALAAMLLWTPAVFARGGGGSGGSHASGSHSSGSHSSGSHASASHSRSHNADGLVHVRGYYRSNGTYVQPHTRGYPGSYVAGYRGTSTDAAVPYDDEEVADESSPPPATVQYRTTARTAARTSYSTGRGSDSPVLLAAKYVAIFTNHKEQPIVSFVVDDDGYRLNFVNGGYGHYPARMIVRFDPIDGVGSSVVVSGAEEETVYVSPKGTEYHLKDCRRLSLTQVPMKLTEAKARFTPCSICRPPE